PTRVSVLAQPGPMRVRRPPETVVERQVVVKTPPPPAPVPFSVKEPVLRRQPGRPLDQEDRARLRESLGNDVPRNAVRPAVPPSPTARGAAPGGRRPPGPAPAPAERRGRAKPPPAAAQCAPGRAAPAIATATAWSATARGEHPPPPGRQPAGERDPRQRVNG